MADFKISSSYMPTGDQPQAIDELVNRIKNGAKNQVLLGVTGSGKTFTMANVIERLNRPALVLVHNKTLAAQLYSEFKALFPGNAVEYFVSYYDYYQPEAYIPASDTFIEKDSSLNENIDRMRLSATRALFERRDVIVVASVSCIYGLGGSDNYFEQAIKLKVGAEMDRQDFLRKLVEIQYERNDMDFSRSKFRARGNLVDVFPAEWEDRAVKISFSGDEIESICVFEPLTGKIISRLDETAIFPATHYVTVKVRLESAIADIMDEMAKRRAYFEGEKRYIEAQRIAERTRYDMELLAQTGFCYGIENYSMHLDGRKPGEPPSTLLDYFPKDFILFVDESHVTLPQVGGMWRGDRSRKETLVEYGFRLPSAIDNRPLTFDEFTQRLNQTVYVSATPGDYELKLAGGAVSEQIIRPTGLIDPEIVVRPAASQVDDLLEEIRIRAAKNQRALVATLTKRMAEELAEYYAGLGVKTNYLHSEIDTIERMDILRDLRKGRFDALIGINLLREGLDLPEVSLVAILDADKEGFLRSSRSLIQTVGRAARNAEGKVILYADRITDSMRVCIDETERRRRKQKAYNEANGITPHSIVKQISDFRIYGEQDYLMTRRMEASDAAAELKEPAQIKEAARALTREMFEAAKELDFEKAAALRDEIKLLETKLNALLGVEGAAESYRAMSLERAAGGKGAKKGGKEFGGREGKKGRR